MTPIAPVRSLHGGRTALPYHTEGVGSRQCGAMPAQASASQRKPVHSVAFDGGFVEREAFCGEPCTAKQKCRLERNSRKLRSVYASSVQGGARLSIWRGRCDNSGLSLRFSSVCTEASEASGDVCRERYLAGCERHVAACLKDGRVSFSDGCD
jgi:hypothetical protein